MWVLLRLKSCGDNFEKIISPDVRIDYYDNNFKFLGKLNFCTKGRRKTNRMFFMYNTILFEKKN